MRESATAISTFAGLSPEAPHFPDLDDLNRRPAAACLAPRPATMASEWAWDPGRWLVFCDEDHETDNPLERLAPLRGRPLGLLIGPEGGFSDAERARLRALAFVTAIPLGPRILRADTAAVAALAVLQAAAGDW